MRMRIVAVLATIAALTGAPSIASGAGNSLVSSTASPTSGTVATIFTLRVSYDGNRPATAVTVSVAGLTLPLTRVDGTAERGTWSVGTVLPAGTWTPRFSARVAQGNAATIVGPTVTVADIPAVAATPAPTVTNVPPSGGDETEGQAPGGADTPGSIVPDPAPGPGDAETVPSPDAEPASSTITTPSPGASGSGPATGSGSGSGTGGSGASRATSSPAPEIPDGGAGGDAPAAPSDPEPDAMPSAPPGAMQAAERAPDEEPEAGVVDDATLGIVLLVGLSGVATVAIIGSTLLLVGRRRAEDEEVAAAVAELGDTDSLLERRTVRQAKVRLADDPIVTAMGIDDQVAARRRRTGGAGQVGSGPGERTDGGR
jgi:hypothetical protein